MLDYIEKGSDVEGARQCMEKFYSQTLDSFQSTNNERLWLKTNIKLSRLWLELKDYGRLTKKVRELHRACQRPDGSDDPSKGTYSLEVYALEIQMYAETRNNKRLKVGFNDDANGVWILMVYIARCYIKRRSRSAPPYPIPRLWASFENVAVKCT